METATKTLIKKTAFEQRRINHVHGLLGDMFLDLHKIAASDPGSRKARQNVLVTLTRLRRDLDALGLRHSSVGGR
jgi:hypothetical protein